MIADIEPQPIENKNKARNRRLYGAFHQILDDHVFMHIFHWIDSLLDGCVRENYMSDACGVSDALSSWPPPTWGKYLVSPAWGTMSFGESCKAEFTAMNR